MEALELCPGLGPSQRCLSFPSTMASTHLFGSHPTNPLWAPTPTPFGVLLKRKGDKMVHGGQPLCPLLPPHLGMGFPWGWVAEATAGVAVPTAVTPGAATPQAWAAGTI